MNMISSLSKIYFHINLLFAASFIVFWGFYQISKFFKLRVGYRQLTRWGQILILASIVFPITLYMMPAKSLPPIGLDSFFLETETNEFTDKAVQKPQSSQSGALSNPIFQKPKVNLLSTLINPLSDWLIFLLWLGGFFIFSGRLIKNSFSLRKLCRESTMIRKFGKVRMVVSDQVKIPFSFRILILNWIVVPLHILENRKDLQLAVKHELQHHRQRDTLWAFFMEMFVCAFYPNPAIYLWKRQITELQEFSCDEELIQRQISSRDYGNCLLRVAETVLKKNIQIYPGTTTMAGVLQRRIEMLTLYKNSRVRRWVAVSIGSLGLFITIAVAYGVEQSARKDINKNPNVGMIVVDEKIQQIAEKNLRDAVKSQKAAEGFAIVADPNTGKILAVANVDSKNKKVGYWALSQNIEPASLSKTLIVAQAIEEGKTTPKEKHSCENGNYSFGGRTYHDWKEKGWSTLSTEDTIANSSDICSIKIAEKIGADGLANMLKNFGFGPNGTAKDFPEATEGQLPPPDDVKHPQLIPYVSLGFGYRSTPIELVQAYGAIANGGNLMKPQNADSKDSDKEVVRRILSPETSQQMREILQQVVMKGTAKVRGESSLYTTAGKTATGFSSGLMKMDWMGGNKKADVAQFIGFAPVNNPRVEVYVGIVDPRADKTGAHGSQNAAPVFKQIVEDVLTLMKVPPDKPQG